MCGSVARRFKLVVFILCAIIASFALQGVEADNGPHGGYTATTDACAGCHRAHTAGANKLLVTASPELCYTCHGVTSGGAQTDVKDGVFIDGVNNRALKGGGFVNALMDTNWDGIASSTPVSSTHIADGHTGIAWGNGAIITGTVNPGLLNFSLSCLSCHDPHGKASTTQGPTYRILRATPLDSGASSGVNVTDEGIKTYTVISTTNNYIGENYGVTGSQLASWCSQCHTRYLASSGSGHTDSGDPLFRFRHTTTSVTCSMCHVAHGSSARMDTYSGKVPWPDGATTPNGNARSSLLRLDSRGVCAYCHVNLQGSVGGGACDTCHDQAQGGRRPVIIGGGARNDSGKTNVAARRTVTVAFNGSNVNVLGIMDYAASQADFAKTSHHVKSTVKNSDCQVCHYTGNHMSGIVYLNNPDGGAVIAYNDSNPAGLETFCVNCHDGNGAAAFGGLLPFSDMQMVPDIKGTAGYLWMDSAHKSRGYSQNGNQPISCLGNGTTTGCHGNAHGSDNVKLLSASASTTLEQFCYNCHAASKVTNDALSNRVGYNSANNIQDAFNKSSKHPLGKSFTLNAKTYTLQCTTCHNPHIVTGKYWEAASGKSPITRPDLSTAPSSNPRAMSRLLWGAGSGQKMSNYAGSGVYVTPKNDGFTGSQLPDYATFCLDCHEGSLTSPSNPNPTQPTYGLINWNGDPHGRMNAGPSNQESSLCPNWYSCGRAYGWDGDDCSGTLGEFQGGCWPVVPVGQGRTSWGREPFTGIRFNAQNAVLACIDCHEAHGSNRGSFIRERFSTTDTGGCGNGDNGFNCADASNWNSNCNACHYYDGNWHAGMGCGSNSCHAGNHTNGTWWNGSSNPHGMEKGGSGSAATNSNRDLVLSYAFENVLKDSGSYQLDAKWYSGSGSFAAGKAGQAAVFGEDVGVQVGTENEFWSTDEGKHGTWKYTEMKFNTTLEAWVYPTDNGKNEYTIFRKHTGYDQGGYGFSLKKVNGTLRAAFNMQADNNGLAQGGAAGVRGAYSSVSIPLNKWTHVAATFNTGGADGNPGNPSVGRIRIYVNGEDVTTSDGAGNSLQPGAGETSIFAYSENSPWNQAICYNGSWCASELAIGGFDWEATNFIGKIDEVKLWNITKDGAYFSAYAAQAAPYISSVTGAIGNNQLTVTFSRGVYTAPGMSGALVAADFVWTDTDNGRTIIAVNHTAGSSTATLTLSSALDPSNDVGVDTVTAASNAIYDRYNNAAGTEAVTVTGSYGCPTSPVSIPLNEPPGSVFVMDTQNMLYGTVVGSGGLTGSEFSGDSSSRHIDFPFNTTCMDATTAATIETRIKPTGLDGTANYLKRIFSRSNYQTSVWRNNSFNGTNYNAPAGTGSIALWVNVADTHGGNAWKPVLTDYTTCPIVSDHWYKIREIWNTAKPGGTPGQPFVPADIFIDDQGTDGNGAGENWSGEVNCTKADQSYHLDVSKVYTGDQILSAPSSNFTIGADWINRTSYMFNGLIDWILWKDSAN